MLDRSARIAACARVVLFHSHDATGEVQPVIGCPMSSRLPYENNETASDTERFAKRPEAPAVQGQHLALPNGDYIPSPDEVLHRSSGL